jgi:TctA family transporter
VPLFRDFAQLDYSQLLPDESTILRFRHLLAQHRLPYAIGLLRVVMRRFAFPTAPVVVGMILGPLTEEPVRNALPNGEGKWGVFFERPMSLVLLVVIVAVLLLPRLLRKRRSPAQAS